MERTLERAGDFALDPSLSRTVLKALVRIYGGDYPRRATNEQLRGILGDEIRKLVTVSYESFWRRLRRGVYQTAAVATGYLTSLVATNAAIYFLLESVKRTGSFADPGYTCELLRCDLVLVVMANLFYYGAVVAAISAVFGVPLAQAKAMLARAKLHRAQKAHENQRRPDPKAYRILYDLCRAQKGQRACSERSPDCSWSKIRLKCEPSGEHAYRTKPEKRGKGYSEEESED